MRLQRWRRPLAPILIAILLPGCSSWQATNLTPPAPSTSGQSANAAPTRQLPDRIRFQLIDGTMVTLDQPRVDGDSLRGINVPMEHASASHEQRLGRVPRAVALADVRRPEAKQASTGNTVALVLVITAVLAVGATIVLGGAIYDSH